MVIVSNRAPQQTLSPTILPSVTLEVLLDARKEPRAWAGSFSLSVSEIVAIDGYSSAVYAPLNTARAQELGAHVSCIYRAIALVGHFVK